MTRYGIESLRELMQRLRDPATGCPWDLRQDHRSLVQHTLEEVYELADAIERGDSAQLRDELGDYLFQAVFYAQISSERGEFDFDDVTQAIVEKLLRRHPHVFPDGTLESRRDPALVPDGDAIRDNWDRSKEADRRERSLEGALDDVPLALPALQRAQKLQRRAAGAGFDWPDASGVFDKFAEELRELQEAVAAGDAEGRADELGDLLFCCVNLARHLGIDAELALRGANAKFERRFRDVEKRALALGKRVQDCDPQALDRMWNEAKANTC